MYYTSNDRRKMTGIFRRFLNANIKEQVGEKLRLIEYLYTDDSDKPGIVEYAKLEDSMGNIYTATLWHNDGFKRFTKEVTTQSDVEVIKTKVNKYVDNSIRTCNVLLNYYNLDDTMRNNIQDILSLLDNNKSVFEVKDFEKMHDIYVKLHALHLHYMSL